MSVKSVGKIAAMAAAITEAGQPTPMAWAAKQKTLHVIVQGKKMSAKISDTDAVKALEAAMVNAMATENVYASWRRQPKNAWTPAEDDVLRRFWPKGIKAVMAKMTDSGFSRSKGTIYARANHLGITKNTPRQAWTTKEIDLIKKHSILGPAGCQKEMDAAGLHRPLGSIKSKMQALGLFERMCPECGTIARFTSQGNCPQCGFSRKGRKEKS